jgi:L-fucose mutarotase
MLKGIDPRLGPDLLSYLRSMGHGDDIVIVDANFPAQANARRLCRADGVNAVDMVRAIMSVLPLDDFVEAAAFSMAVVGAPDEAPAIVSDFADELRAAGYNGPVVALERQAFYERARNAFVIVATGELRVYGNLILAKGLVRPGPGS